MSGCLNELKADCQDEKAVDWVLMEEVGITVEDFIASPKYEPLILLYGGCQVRNIKDLVQRIRRGDVTDIQALAIALLVLGRLVGNKEKEREVLEW